MFRKYHQMMIKHKFPTVTQAPTIEVQSDDDLFLKELQAKAIDIINSSSIKSAFDNSSEISALDRVSIRRLIMKIKESLNDVMQESLFEPNDALTRDISET